MPPVSQPVSGRLYPRPLLGQATGSIRRLYRFDKHHHCGQYDDLNIDDTVTYMNLKPDRGREVDVCAGVVDKYMQTKQIGTDWSSQASPQLSSFVQAFHYRHEPKPAYYFVRWMVAIAQQSCQMRRRYPRRTGRVASDTRTRMVAGPCLQLSVWL
jgi:hypothetical protein